MATATEITVDLPPLYRKQHEAIYAPERYSLIEASTKAGKTVGCIVWQFSRCLQDVGVHWWVAPVYTQARIAYRRAKKLVPAALLSSTSDSELEIRLANGSVWQFKSAEKPDNLYGEDVRSAVLDEASRMREASWHAVRSTLTATRGPLRVIGNVRGRGNWHYRMARKAESGAKGMRYTKITADDAVEAGVLSREEIEDAREMLPDHVFRELYYCEATDDGSNPFGISHIAQCVSPLSAKPVKVWGVDLARVMDWTVVIGLDEDGAVAHFDRWRLPWLASAERVAQLVGPDAVGCIDATGVGDPVCEILESKGVHLERFVFTSQSKQRIIEALALDIQAGRIRFPDGPIRHELESFEYVTRRTSVQYSAPDGEHDDCVCALALARNAMHPKPQPAFVAFAM